ncbi:MAG: PKD domain-containing protein, partial [Bacteroidales bacterium]|nr:PKD domain-containing protein [Bacteroidales bacterium]
IYTDGASIWNGFYFEEGINTGADPTSNEDSWGIIDLAWYHGKLYAATSYGCPYPGDTIPSTFFYIDSNMRWTPVGGITTPLDLERNAFCVYKDDLYWGAYYYPSDTSIEDTIIPGVRGTFGRWHAPPATDCFWLMPRVLAHADTFYLPQGGGTVDVPLYNNNAYADSWSWDFDDTTTDTVKDPLHTYSQIGTYHVSVTVTEDGCTKTAEKDIVIMESTDVGSLSLKDVVFKIYPNPTKQDFTVEITLPETLTEKSRFFVTGINGATKYQRQLQAGFNRFEISTGGWYPATYICNLMVGGKFLGSKKLILNK